MGAVEKTLGRRLGCWLAMLAPMVVTALPLAAQDFGPGWDKPPASCCSSEANLPWKTDGLDGGPGPAGPTFLSGPSGHGGCQSCGGASQPWHQGCPLYGNGPGPWFELCEGACAPCYTARTEEEKRAMMENCAGCKVNWGRGYCDLPPPCSAPCIRWYASAELAPLVYDVDDDIDFATLGPLGEDVVSTDDLHTKYQEGARVIVGYALDNYWRVEGQLVGRHEWEHSDSYADADPNTEGGTGNLFSPFSGFGNPPILGLDFNELAQITLRSEYSSMELNVRHRGPLRCGPLEISLLFGLRHAQIDESFNYLTVANVPAPLGAVNDVQVETENRLLGFQLGALVEHHISDTWQVNFEGKAALCRNEARQATVYTNTDSTGAVTVFPGEVAEDVTAGIAELSVVMHYHITPRIALLMGYQLLWVRGLALGADNFQEDIDILTLGPPLLEHEGEVVYHGPTLGLTAGW
jgi:hypothetical protein